MALYIGSVLQVLQGSSAALSLLGGFSLDALIGKGFIVANEIPEDLVFWCSTNGFAQASSGGPDRIEMVGVIGIEPTTLPV